MAIADFLSDDCGLRLRIVDLDCRLSIWARAPIGSLQSESSIVNRQFRSTIVNRQFRSTIVNRQSSISFDNRQSQSTIDNPKIGSHQSAIRHRVC